jgi:amino acid transporter
VFVIFISINAALIKFRYSLPKAKRSFKTPINIGKFPILPALGIVFCSYLLLNLSVEVLFYGVLLLAVCVVIQIVLSKLGIESDKLY